MLWCSCLVHWASIQAQLNVCHRVGDTKPNWRVPNWWVRSVQVCWWWVFFVPPWETACGLAGVSWLWTKSQACLAIPRVFLDVTNFPQGYAYVFHVCTLALAILMSLEFLVQQQGRQRYSQFHLKAMVESIWYYRACRALMSASQWLGILTLPTYQVWCHVLWCFMTIPNGQEKVHVASGCLQRTAYVCSVRCYWAMHSTSRNAPTCRGAWHARRRVSHCHAFLVFSCTA